MSLRDFAGISHAPRGVLVGIVCHFLVMPSVGFGLTKLFHFPDEIAAGIILIVVLFFSHLLSALPQPVLAAIVLVAVAGLFKLSTLQQLWRGDRREFVVAMAALLFRE